MAEGLSFAGRDDQIIIGQKITQLELTTPGDGRGVQFIADAIAVAIDGRRLVRIVVCHLVELMLCVNRSVKRGEGEDMRELNRSSRVVGRRQRRIFAYNYCRVQILLFGRS